MSYFEDTYLDLHKRCEDLLAFAGSQSDDESQMEKLIEDCSEQLSRDFQKKGSKDFLTHISTLLEFTGEFLKHLKYRSLKPYNSDKLDEVLSCLKKARMIDSNDHLLKKFYSVMLFIMNKIKKANTFIEKEFINNSSNGSSDWVAPYYGSLLINIFQYKAALKWLKKALDDNNKEPGILRYYGIALYLERNFKEAEKYFTLAINENENDYNSKLWLGNLYTTKGDYDKALELYNSLISANSAPQDIKYSLLCSRAFCYALKGNEKDKEREENREKALADLESAKKIEKDKVSTNHSLMLIHLLWGEIKKAKEFYNETDIKHYEDPALLVQQIAIVYSAIAPKTKGYFVKKERDEELFDKFLDLNDPSTRINPFDDSRIFFMGLRKWNSFTPSLPTASHDSVGGGYFLFYDGKGTVIDPGFDFINNFDKAGGKLTNIHNIIITHAHNDHTNDLETLLTLLHRRQTQLDKKKNQEKNGEQWEDDDHRVTLYLNLGTYKKYSGYLDLRANYLEDVRVINCGEKYNLTESKDGSKKLELRVLPAYHDEVLSRKYSVGLHFIITKEDKSTKNIIFTSDTGLCPTKVGAEGEDEIDFNDVVCSKYFTPPDDPEPDEIDLLVVHVGSIQKTEMDPFNLMCFHRLGVGKGGMLPINESILYRNHLGVHGVVKVITKLKPKLALVSEFGEELKGFLPELMDDLKDCVDFFMSNSEKIVVAPCALFLFYDLDAEKIFSVINGQFEPIQSIDYITIESWDGEKSEADEQKIDPETHGNFIFYNKNKKDELKLNGEINTGRDGLKNLMDDIKNGNGPFATK